MFDSKSSTIPLGFAEIAERQHRHHPGHHLENAQVGLDDLADLRALHLDDDVLTVQQLGRVHLGDRRGRERLRVDRREDLRGRLSQVLSQDLVDRFEAKRADAVEALAKLEAVPLREESLAGGHELTQLDVRRTELLERAANHQRPRGRVSAEPDDDGGTEGLEPDPHRGQDAPHRARHEHDDERENRAPDRNGQQVSVHRRMIDEPRRSARQVGEGFTRPARRARADVTTTARGGSCTRSGGSPRSPACRLACRRAEERSVRDPGWRA